MIAPRDRTTLGGEYKKELRLARSTDIFLQYESLNRVIPTTPDLHEFAETASTASS